MRRFDLKLVVIIGLLSLACTTKVSEWVLLNSVANKYLLVYYHKNELSKEEQKQNIELEKQFSSANIILKSKQKNDIVKPYYALYFNRRLLSKYNTKNEVLNISTSPKRKIIAKELMDGKLCVMLYLKCGIPEKDELGLKSLKQSVSASPFGEVITIVELERKCTDEKQFVSLLLNVESDLKDIKEPMLFGIFGKFRALEPLVAKGITQENINLMIDFLTADCSCLIKDDLPGTNILYSETWKDPQTAEINKIMNKNPHLEHQ